MKLTTKLTDLDHAEVAREFNLDTDLVNDVASGVYTVDVLWDAVAAEVAARLARKCGPASWNGDGLMRVDWAVDVRSERTWDLGNVVNVGVAVFLEAAFAGYPALDCTQPADGLDVAAVRQVLAELYCDYDYGYLIDEDGEPGAM